jgi:cell fate regulator YaaT (PSP1 superfamily)
MAPGRHRPYVCACEDDGLEVGDRLLIQVEGKTRFGTVVRVPIRFDESHGEPGGEVLRKASHTDEERESHLQARREEWLQIAREKVSAHGLPMRLLRADIAPNLKKVTFQFVADGRVDFRALVRDLARSLRTRVELRQIGVRDATVLQGGIAHCGRPLCCATFLPEFAPVSMKMAKAQGLPLNPAKISGQCGRLMCCLRYEVDEQERKRPPRAAGGRARAHSRKRRQDGRSQPAEPERGDEGEPSSE